MRDPAWALTNVVPTQLAPRRPVKAYYETRSGQNVVTLLYVQGVHPGAGG